MGGSFRWPWPGKNFMRTKDGVRDSYFNNNDYLLGGYMGNSNDVKGTDLGKRKLIKMSAGLVAGAAVLGSPAVSEVFANETKMKVLLVNGSPNEKGCTYTGLMEIAETLQKEGVDTEIFHIGSDPISGCIACGVCRSNNSGRCVIPDRVNVFLEMAEKTDGFIFGTPVHFAAVSGAMTSFMDRVWYAAKGDVFALKPGAAIASARRAGTAAALDQLNKYLTYREMFVVSSRYWNMIHGTKPEDVKQDLEGLQVLRILARNMAWFLRCKAAATKAGVSLPQREQQHMRTNFIR